METRQRPPAVPTPLFLSSGDLLADRRYDLAKDLEGRGDVAAAADLLVQAVERAPAFASAWFALGEVRERAGDRQGAITAFAKSCDADPADRHGAVLRLARLDGNLPWPAMPTAYLRTLFDQYAPCFEQALVGGLGYRGPALLRAAVERARRDQGGPIAFGRMMDLGCGTGLLAEAFADCCASIVGIDASPAMIKEARRSRRYDELVVGDMVEWLGMQDEGCADLVGAADSFVYLADLEPACRGVRHVLAAGGLFAFTVEAHDGDGVVLGEKLRFAHGARHVRRAIEEAGLDLLALGPASTRTENGVPVPGLLAVAGRSRYP